MRSLRLPWSDEVASARHRASSGSRRWNAVVLLAITAFIAGCGGDEKASTDSGAQAEPAATSGADGRSQVIQQVSRSLAAVTALPKGERRTAAKGAPHSHGSGVVYDRSGLVLTSNHFVEDVGSLEVIINGRTFQGRAVARAQCNDLAIVKLRPRPTGLQPIKMAADDAAQPGGEAVAIGYLRPPGSPAPQLISTTGALAAVNVPGQIHPDLPQVESLVLHQAPLQPAMSGGALVNERGEMVGISTLLDPGKDGAGGTFQAVSVAQVRKLLGQLQETEGAVFGGWEDQHKCHGAMAKLTKSDYKAHASH